MAYGFEDAECVSPTEREFDVATRRRKHRLVFVKGADDRGRHPRMQALIRKAGSPPRHAAAEGFAARCGPASSVTVSLTAVQELDRNSGTGL
jgi:hypothetical protein